MHVRLTLTAAALAALAVACTGNAEPVRATSTPTSSAVATTAATATSAATSVAVAATSTPSATPTAASVTATPAAAPAAIATVASTPAPTQAPPPPPPPAARISLDIQGFGFPPATVKRGTTVTWTNRDPLAHDVTSNDPEFKFKSPTLNEGESFSRTFDTTGTVNYICSIHPFMGGTITVQ